MTIDKKKMQVNMYELLTETKEIQKALESRTAKSGILDFYITLDRQIVKEPTFVSLQKQADEFKAQAEKQTIQSGLFGKIGSKVDKALDKTMGVITEQMVSLAPTNDARCASIIMYNKETIGKHFGIYVVESLENIVKSSKQKAVLSLTDTDYAEITNTKLIPSGLSLGILFDSVEDIIKFEQRVDNVDLAVSTMVQRVVAGLNLGEDIYADINICTLEDSDAVAVNIIKLVNKGSDDEENEFTGTCNEVSIEALCVDGENNSRLLRCRDTFGEKSTIVTSHQDEDIDGIKAYGEIQFIVNNIVMRQGDDLILEYYNECIKEVNECSDKSNKLAMLIIPKGYDLSSSFKAKYI